MIHNKGRTDNGYRRDRNPGQQLKSCAMGLLGFGMTDILLNIHNAGFFPVNSMILVMGVFYGGLAQIVAGVLEHGRWGQSKFSDLSRRQQRLL